MMKWVTILFLLANVGYFGWHMNQQLSHVASATSSDKKVIPASTERLVLLSELDELPPLRQNNVITEIGEDELFQQQASVENLASEQIPFSLNGTCLSIGPYESQDSLQNLSNWLQIQGLPSKERIEEIRTRERYWVYLEPQNASAAKAQLEDLKNKGVSDYYMVSKGDMKNAISLGLFSTQNSVNRRLAELEKEGYNPVVVPQHKITRVFWIDAQIDEGLTLPELPEDVEITNLDCLEIALLSSDQ